MEDAESCLMRSSDALIKFQVAGIYALISAKTQDERLRAEYRQEAFRLLSLALRDGFGHDLIETDPDLQALHDDPRFHDLARAARLIRAFASVKRLLLEDSKTR